MALQHVVALHKQKSGAMVGSHLLSHAHEAPWEHELHDPGSTPAHGVRRVAKNYGALFNAVVP